MTETPSEGSIDSDPLQESLWVRFNWKTRNSSHCLLRAGSNGKTTLVEIVRAALGDQEYAGEVNIDNLMVRPKEASSSNAVNSDFPTFAVVDWFLPAKWNKDRDSRSAA